MNAAKSMLDGRTALIVEEEFLIALDIQRMLEVFGIGQTLFARNAADAEQMRDHWSDIALAVIEVRPADGAGHELAHNLSACGIPIVLISADYNNKTSGTARPIVAKPIPEAAFNDAVVRALSTPS